jgi:hypothetical protein
MTFTYGYDCLPKGFDLSTAFSPWTRLQRLSIQIVLDTASDSSLQRLGEGIQRSQLELELLEIYIPLYGTIEGIIVRNSNPKRLILSCCNISQQGRTQAPPSLASLQSVEFHDSGMNTMESQLRVFQACPLIRHIDLQHLYIPSHQLKVIADTTTALTSLSLTCCTFADADGLFLTNVPDWKNCMFMITPE